MKTTLHTIQSSILGISAALLMPIVANAAGPSGSFTNIVADATNAVWDFGGVITNVDIDVSSVKAGVDVQAALPTDFTQSGTGKVSASQPDVTITPTVNGQSFSYPAAVTEKGSVNSTQGGSHLIFSVTAVGTGTLPQASKPGKIALGIQINATINSATQTIFGTMKDSATASGHGSVTETQSFSNTVAEVGSGGLGDGSWMLTLNNLSTSNNAVTGTATITLSSGQSFNYSVKGAFNATKGTKLVLTGSDANSKGSAIQVTLDTNNTVTNIKGRITGQNVNASF
jgi:hypothetical protein